MNDLAFPAQEFEERLGKVREQMKSRGLDALILTRSENIYYMSGFRASHFASWLSELHAVIVPAEGEPRLMTRALEKEIVKVQWTKSPQLFMDHEDPYDILVRILEESGNTDKKIGVEERFLKVSQLKNIQQYLPLATFVDATNLVESVAASPSQAESNCMREAARITNIGFQKGIELVREGIYPYEIIGEVHNAMYKAGQSDFDMSLVTVWSGPQGGMMHDTSTTEKIKKGDITNIEIWGINKQYKAGAQGSLYIGDTPPENIAEAYDLIANMLVQAKEAVKAGATAGDIFDGANSVYRPVRGLDYYRRVGGSMGLTVFNIDLVKGRKDVLKPGVSLLLQMLVDDPVLLTTASTVMVTEEGYEELVPPLPKLMTV
jgi:Xaa-Pro dipeptidase